MHTNLLILLYCGVFFIACSDSSNKRADIQKEDTTARTGEVKPLTITPPQPISSDEIKSIMKDEKLKGDIVYSKQWNDASGKNILVLIEGKIQKGIPDGHEGEDGRMWRQEIYGCQYCIRNDSIIKVWQLVDFERSDEYDLWIKYSLDSLLIRDLDGDNIAEVAFFYEHDVISDGEHNADYKFLLYSKGKKYAIRGQTPYQFEKKIYERGVHEPGTRVNDPLLSTAPVAIRNYMNNACDEYLSRAE